MNIETKKYRIKDFDFKRFLKIVSPHKKGLWAALFFSIFGAVIEAAIPIMVQPLVDTAAVKNATFLGIESPILGIDSPWIVPFTIAFTIALLFSLRALVNFADGYVMTWSLSGMVYDTRNALFKHLLYVDPKVYEQNSASHFINTIGGIAPGGIGAFVGTTKTLIKEGLTTFLILGYMFWTNWKLTLIAFIVLPCAALAIKFVRKTLAQLAFSSQIGGDKLNYTVEENTLAYRIVRLHGIQNYQEGRFADVSAFLRDLGRKSAFTGSILTPITQIMAAIAIAIIITIALKETQDNNQSVGSFVSYIGAMLMLVPRAKALSGVFPALQNGTIAMNRVFELLDQPREADTGTFTLERAAGSLQIQNLTKIYPQSDHPALDAISFDVDAGETVALVGHSGSGKTTLVNMLPRFVEATSGQIALDGTPLQDWSLPSLRKQISMVSQDVILFNTTVAENVALGESAETLDRKRVKKSLKMAHLLDFIETLPNGIDADIGHNGHRFSGGQRQRLAIARALYRDTPILILDEATSALDSESERLVQLALESLTSERTTLVVAHRLSTIRNADRIIVLDNGHIIEAGSYDELIANDGAFAKLVEAQSAMQTAPEL